MARNKRVVVTGIGSVTAAGVGAEKLWVAARDGKSCITTPKFPWPYKGRLTVAAQVQDFDAEKYLAGETIQSLDSDLRVKPFFAEGSTISMREFISVLSC